jgi:hypothetical protein
VGVLIISLLKVLYGGTMMLLVTSIMPAASGTPATRTADLWRQIQREYEFHGISKDYRFTNLKLSMFSPKGLNIIFISKRLRS